MNLPKEDVSTTKRVLLKAGWVAPLIVAINLPASSFAGNSSVGRNQNDQGRNQNDKGGNQNDQGDNQNDQGGNQNDQGGNQNR